jgi:arylsulfatase A-like enzyme
MANKEPVGMNRRTFLGGVPGGLGGFAASTSPASRAPNVIFILTDDQGWWDLGVHGNPVIETPVLDRLAGEGVRFSRCYTSPVCTPTRAGLMTGRYYQRTGAIDSICGRDNLRLDEITLADVFHQRGYRTAWWASGTSTATRATTPCTAASMSSSASPRPT